MELFVMSHSSDVIEGYSSLDKRNCTVVSMCVLFNLEYGKCYDFLKSCGREQNKGAKGEHIEEAFNRIAKKGVYKVSKTFYKRRGRPTLKKFIQDNPTGDFYILVRGHALVIKDSVLYDYKESLRRQVKVAYKVSKVKK